MSKKIIICITVLLFSGFMYAKGAFVEVGDPSFFPDDLTSLISMKIDNDGNIYAAYIQDDYYFSVAKFDGESWSDVGERKFSGEIGNIPNTPNVEPNVDFVLGSDGIPYVSFPASSSYSLNVMKFNKTKNKWENAGSQNITDFKVSYTSIAVDSKKMPYVIFSGCTNDSCKGTNDDEQDIERVSVMKFNNNNWEFVGAPMFFYRSGSFNNNILFDSSNTPVIAFSNGNVDVFVMKFNGEEWVFAGDTDSLDIEKYGSLHGSFFIDSKDNLYFDAAGAYGVYNAGLMRFNGSGWQRIADLESYGCSFAIDKNDAIYSAYIKVYNESSDSILKLNVQKFNGSEWEFLASPDFKTDVSDQLISIDNNNIPWILLKNRNDEIELLKYDPEAGETPDDSDDDIVSDEETASDEDSVPVNDKDSGSSGCGLILL